MQGCSRVLRVSDKAKKQREADCKLVLSTLQKWGSGGEVKKLTLSFATGGGCVEKMKMRMNNAAWHSVCVSTLASISSVCEHRAV